jgi:hypothetical protein
MGRNNNRLIRLEKISPANSKPWIQLIKQKGETTEEVFAESKYSGKLEDYNLWIVKIVESATASSVS